MTVATSSRRNSRRSSLSSESSLTNHTASAKPKNSYIQKNSSVSGGGGTSHSCYSHKGRSGSGFGSSSSYENRAYLVSGGGSCIGNNGSMGSMNRGLLTPNAHLDDLSAERVGNSSPNWTLSTDVCSLKDFKGLLECKSEHAESVLRKYSGIKGMNGGRGIRQVLASIVRGSRTSKNRSSSVDSGSCGASSSSSSTGLVSNINRKNTAGGDGTGVRITSEESIDGVSNNDSRECNILTGQPIQKAILTQRDIMELRGKIDKVLSTEDSFVRSALQSFQQFDLDGDGNLTIEELLDLLTTLGEHLALPPINRKVVANEISIRLNSKLTVDSNASESRMLISFPFFLKYYLSVLTTIRQKHFSSVRANGELQQNRAIRKHLVHEDDINDLYTFHYQLGAGTYGEVFLVTENYTRQRRVCKIVDKVKCRRKLDEIDHEVEILKQLDHPGLVHIYEVYEDRLNLYFILEFCAGGNLFHSLQDAIQSGFRFSEFHVSRIIQQILLAIRYLHLKRVVHKNLKPQNILLTNSFGSGNTSVKLVDFGLAEIFSSDEMILLDSSSTPSTDSFLESSLQSLPTSSLSSYLNQGSVKTQTHAQNSLFSNPCRNNVNEVTNISGVSSNQNSNPSLNANRNLGSNLDGSHLKESSNLHKHQNQQQKESSTSYSKYLDFTAPEILKGEPFSYSLDVWSVGVIMYSIITGRHPFCGRSRAETRHNICFGAPAISEITCVSNACKSLLGKLLEKNPRERISVDEALSHDWFSISHSSYCEVDIGMPLLAHLKVYTRQSELRHILIHMLSHQLALDTTQINMATSVFKSLDTDHDGVLSVSELSCGLQKLGISSRESSMIIKAMDIDGNGIISYSEFISACHIWRQNEIRQLKSFFMKIDRNNQGKITREEFKQLLKAQKSKLLSNITKSFSAGNEVNYRTILPSSNQGVYTEWDSVLDEIDTNRDGLIDWKEFCTFIVDYFNTSRESLRACYNSGNISNLPSPTISVSSPFATDPTDVVGLGRRVSGLRPMQETKPT
ncbi:CDPK2 protein-related protein [Cryptosporidium ubiquitum]|uniref:non-specific serine/threonine protein kinase n=1 Tax=Cryptosporidium ubiquitum TaxID=857276 RepID=A0A1J4MLX1_9CRYT|nr:CDPK2 protein-related protein [Cryptosporidium ubiquitum]OII73996.1 CDPK2 protein-related protein [Cryptosporidium ubiquitum]